MTIADDLLGIASTIAARKSALKAAIEAKGVPVGDVPFSDYAGLIMLIEGGGPTPVDVGLYDATDGLILTDDGLILFDAED